jgi:hypothetical protein
MVPPETNRGDSRHCDPNSQSTEDGWRHRLVCFFDLKRRVLVNVENTHDDEFGNWNEGYRNVVAPGCVTERDGGAERDTVAR